MKRKLFKDIFLLICLLIATCNPVCFNAQKHFLNTTKTTDVNATFSTPAVIAAVPANTVSPVVCNATSEAFLKKYGQQSFYIPQKKQKVITLKITVHVFKPLGDSGRWHMTDSPIDGLPAMKTLFDSITNGHQDRYSAKRRASYDVQNFTSPYINDSKIQYEITNIYVYENREFYYLNNDYALFEYIEKNYPGRINEGMPLVFNGSNGPGHLSSYKGSSAIVTTLSSFDPVFGRSHLLHEIGHAFGLGHTYVNTDGGGSDWQNFNGACNSQDYLNDVFPGNNPACQNERQATFKPNNPPCFSCYESTPDTSNNLMGGQRYNLWTSPLQMGRRLRSMHLNYNNGQNMRAYAKDTESDHKNVLTISKNEIWDFDIQLYSDIVIKTGVSLTVSCKVAMAIDGKIKLEKGAKLIVDGGEVTGWCKTGNWYGIETPTIKNKAGKILVTDSRHIKFINGGQFTKCKNLYK